MCRCAAKRTLHARHCNMLLSDSPGWCRVQVWGDCLAAFVGVREAAASGHAGRHWRELCQHALRIKRLVVLFDDHRPPTDRADAIAGSAASLNLGLRAPHSAESLQELVYHSMPRICWNDFSLSDKVSIPTVLRAVSPPTTTVDLFATLPRTSPDS